MIRGFKRVDSRREGVVITQIRQILNHELFPMDVQAVKKMLYTLDLLSPEDDHRYNYSMVLYKVMAYGRAAMELKKPKTLRLTTDLDELLRRLRRKLAKRDLPKILSALDDKKDRKVPFFKIFHQFEQVSSLRYASPNAFQMNIKLNKDEERLLVKNLPLKDKGCVDYIHFCRLILKGLGSVDGKLSPAIPWTSLVMLCSEGDNQEG